MEWNNVICNYYAQKKEEREKYADSIFGKPKVCLIKMIVSFSYILYKKYVQDQVGSVKKPTKAEPLREYNNKF